MSLAFRQRGDDMDFQYDDLIGIPFMDGGRKKQDGLDCWGLAMICFKRQGVELPDYPIGAMETREIAGMMAGEESKWEKLAEPLPGCLVVIRLDTDVWANHVGVYVGGGRFIHAYSGTGSCLDRVRHWRSRIVGFYQPKR